MFERRHPYGTTITIAIVLGMAFWFAGGSRVKDTTPYYFKRALGQTASVTIQNTAIKAEVARTPHARNTGLSGRIYLAPGHGMLFLFPTAGYYNFTMEKTKILLDIIWIRNNIIVDIVARAKPGQTIVETSSEADAVLEIGGGSSSSYGWRVGDSINVVFDEPIIHF